MPTLPRCTYVRQIYLDKNFLGDDQIPAVCRLIDYHPYLIRLKLGHNNFSQAGIQQICDYARARNPYLFHTAVPTLQAEFSAPVSTYGADANGARMAPATECWVVHAEPVNGPPFVEVRSDPPDAHRFIQPQCIANSKTAGGRRVLSSYSLFALD